MNPDYLDAARGVADDVVSIRRDIHTHPELGLDNPRTQGVILESLTGLGFEVSTGDGLTSIVADLIVDPDAPTVLLRADTDALPMTEDTDVSFRSVEEGRAHACGHDAHVAMLTGAARLLSENKSELTNNVRLMFQPGEEGHAGAKYMIDQGVLDGVDRAFAIHITPNIPAGFIATKSGALMASADEFDITVTGKGGHASTPHFCNDPLPAAASIVGDLQTMVTRNIEAFNPGVVTVTQMHAGTTHNVIPENATVGGTIRAVSEHSRASMHEGVHRIAQGISAAHGCTCSVDLRIGYPVTVNHADQVDLVAAKAIEAFGQDHFIEMPTPVMGAEDFSYVLHDVPGAMAFLGVCPADIDDFFEAAPCHSNRMRLNEDAMPTGVAMHLAMALA